MRSTLRLGLSFSKTKNYYHILGVSAGATQEEIKQAYRQLAKKHHPDLNNGNDCAFKNINEAYEVLSDMAARNNYDSTRIRQDIRQEPKHADPPSQQNYSNPWSALSAEQRELLEMMRRHQQEYMRQYQRSFSRRQFRYRSQQEAKEDQYIRRYYQNANRREGNQRQEGGNQRQDGGGRQYNQHFDRSKDSVVRSAVEAIKGLWNLWKDFKSKK